MTYELPMDYISLGTKTIEDDCTVNDICDFVVEYINSDVLVFPLYLRTQGTSKDTLGPPIGSVTHDCR